MRTINQLLKMLCLVSIIAELAPIAARGQTLELQAERSGGDEKSLMDVFLDNNPLAVELNILTEGTKAYVCADDENVFVRLSVPNPMLFMRMLMQGVTVSIDPTCRKKRNYSAIFPSAADAEQQTAIESKTTQTDVGDRPDIGPLIMAMNKLGAIFKISGKTGKPDASRSFIELDDENEALNFYVLFPKTQMLEEKKLSGMWQLGIYVERPSDDMAPPSAGDREELLGHRPPTSNRDMPVGNIEEDNTLREKINAWTKFSIDEIDNINLK